MEFAHLVHRPSGPSKCKPAECDISLVLDGLFVIVLLGKLL